MKLLKEKKDFNTLQQKTTSNLIFCRTRKKEFLNNGSFVLNDEHEENIQEKHVEERKKEPMLRKSVI